MENKNFRTWLDEMELNHPLVIAGPCSAETEEQVLEIAEELKNTDATCLEQVYGNHEPDQEVLRELVQKPSLATKSKREDRITYCN